MKKLVVLIAGVLSAGSVFANPSVTETFGATQDLLVNEDVKELQIVDINSDNRKDLVWTTSKGAVKYKLRNNDAIASLETLPGTRWRLEYTMNGQVKFVSFTTGGGIIETDNDKVYKINKLSMGEAGELWFCTPLVNGLDRTDCAWHYKITDILPNVMIGTDQRTGAKWVANKIVAE
ncbi:hypothetical protein [Pseudoalteromonas luteoviolacea]|uniref:PLAT domain-containing protein n=1 Tax=Pseudoalteromonas luteoviolacea H33 TaxID=1365251 RepID=A0A161Y7T6_9GAMM|nr:hypothetical protein [Pseudoalteromonas luteoviolacea]KZN51751.1 hypothetical protein N476_11960 [Pseudoalteromonas luteoviolacea H33]KZN72756.1 hypothetical protein N477_24500 [Pseudoalteromonas luteoviolacea H33-S]